MSRSRSKSRRLAVQALYQWQVAGGDVHDIERQFAVDQDMNGVDLDYFQELLRQVSAQAPAIDEHYARLIDRKVSELDPVERAILRLGVFELRDRLDVPYRVVINEAVELAKTFGATKSHKYINGVLDKVARELRAAEIKARATP